MKIKLYVSGKAERAQSIVNQVKAVLQQLNEDAGDLTVVDVLNEPQKASEDNILATPTLAVWGKSGCHRIVGDFRNTSKVISFLKPVLNGKGSQTP